MAKLPDFDPIGFLIHRKFGAATVRGQPLPSLSGGRLARIDPDIARQIAAFKDELSKLPPDELQALMGSELRAQREEWAAKAELEERQRFFNQPAASADFDHWSRCAHWTLDEAIALSFGKAPERVNWRRVEPFVNVSDFALAYQRRRDLAVRAVAWDQLFDPVLPGIFLAWAKRSQLDVSSQLQAAVAARGIQVADWKTLYDNQKAAYDELRSGFDEIRRMNAEKSEMIQALKSQLQELNAREEARVRDNGGGGSEKSLGARERDSLLKLIIGMAVGGYGYDPTAARSDQPAAIASDLAAAGITLDVDTVRKWLKQACDLLPPNQAE
jgi:hypothetical protein